MACFYPMTGYVRESGGRPVFEPPTEPHRIVRLPCGGCIGCRVDKSRDWQMRMVHEMQLHDVSQFLTLTYDEDHVPRDYSLNHRHWQLFMKLLRKRTKSRLRFVMCGEYGEKNSRPHYHAIVFGLPLDDLWFWRMSKGHRTYRSPFLEEIWGRGHVYVGETVTQETCGYVATYLLKNGSRDSREDFVFEDVDTGERVFRRSPYLQMSRRPGIGHDWLERYLGDVFPADSVVRRVRRKRGGFVNREAGAPAYYRRLLRRWDPSMYARVAERREALARDPALAADRTPARLKTREEIALRRLRDVEQSL